MGVIFRRHDDEFRAKQGGHNGINREAVLRHDNLSARRHGGRVEAVYTSKTAGDCETGTCVLDFERGVAGGIAANPWQTDTCIGEWHYNREAKYKTPKRVIDMLVDIVSRNGNLMLNFPLPNSGALDDQELKILDEITRWMAVNQRMFVRNSGPITAKARL